MKADSVVAREYRESNVLDLAHLAEVGAFMEKVFSRPEPRPEAAEPVATSAELSEVEQVVAEAEMEDEDRTDVLLAKASRAIETLAARCEIVAYECAEAIQRAAEQEHATERWKAIALELRTQAAFNLAAVEEWKVLLHKAESRILSLEAAAEEARQRVAVADARSTHLHGQVVAAFGCRSSIHSVLQSITLQEAAE